MFTGFTDETVDFMWGIRFNNERSWFEAHKEIYLEHFYRPMTELADEIYAFLREQRPDYGLVRKVTRIYRDARRLHHLTPSFLKFPQMSASTRSSLALAVGRSSTFTPKVRSFVRTMPVSYTHLILSAFCFLRVLAIVQTIPDSLSNRFAFARMAL